MGMKSLINPLFAFLLLHIGAAGWLLRRHKGLGHALPLLLLCSALLLCVLSMPFIGNALEASLRMDVPEQVAFLPTHIFVLGGGYQLGRQAGEDLLIFESQRRVLQGVAVWKSYPTARLVFSGVSREDGRDEARHAELMRDMAVARGVPTGSIMLETQSLNTREHPVEALRLPGVSAVTPLGLVTSGWHMRRAQREFCRHFQDVVLFPVPEVVQPWQWQDFVPTAGALDDNTTLLREWAGLLWYAIVHRFENQSTASSLCAP